MRFRLDSPLLPNRTLVHGPKASLKTGKEACEACTEAGHLGYGIVMDTPRFLATSLGDRPLVSISLNLVWQSACSALAVR